MRIVSKLNHAIQRAPNLATLVVALVVLAIFFRLQILNHFNYLSGDRYDGVIQVALLEHWFNVFTGWSNWRSPNYFYPYPNILGFNEGQFLYGAIYSIFRTLGIDGFLANELVNVAIKAIGFFGFIAAGRRILKLPLAWALLGAAIFTLSNNSFLQMSHAQLLSVAFAPVEAVLIYEAIGALLAHDARRLFRFGSIAGVFFAAWLITCLYTAWFFTLFAMVTLAVLLLTAGRPGLARLWQAIMANKLAIAGIAMVTGLALVPFVSVYTGGVSRQRAWSEILFYLPNLWDTVNVSTGNLLYGGVIEYLLAHCSRCHFGNGEMEAGLSPVLLALTGMCMFSIFRRKSAAGLAEKAALVSIAAASLILWVMALRIDGHSAWFLIYKFWPGGNGLRVVARIALLLALPATALAVWYLSRSSWPPLALLAIGTVLLAEQINTRPITTLDRRLMLERTSGIAAPPASCRAFFTTASPDTVEGDESFPVGALYPHNVDAMLIAEYVHLPTINGVASFHPADWNFGSPGSPDYLQRVKVFADAHKLEGLCQLDLKTRQWNSRPVFAATSERVAYWDLSNASEAIPADSLQGFSPAQTFGRWSEGKEASFKYTLPDSAGNGDLTLQIVLITALVNDRHSQRMLVSVNGGEKHEFVFKTTARANAELRLPAAREGVIRMEFPDAISPKELGINADTRPLAAGIKSFEIRRAIKAE
ncbi:hypothetical protein GJV26_18625 [Massilia dura]|uniref:YfhO family protein n=1 Tax=Pseudoduganella dura TaxID=321982 RepID=A0A6I3XDI1_9BURK|nr:hypothetical protein [Pseudoduganella dura]MUI14457.1 hypothetical protein [Pseudoduganella dura]GGY07970.1 hypothetical protein GCM10007386_43050 [Pseudoduganella dura]